MYLKDKRYLMSAVASFLLLCVSLIVNYYAGTYATNRASNSVTDLILDNTRVYDLDGVFIYGTIVFWIFVGVLLIRRPDVLPFTLKSVALFTIIRAFFITLTHIGPFPTQIAVDPGVLMSKFTFGGDLFFSGHTGLPFLLALVFWQKPLLRYFFIASSIGFGTVVLLAHLHYSIDVLSAFFITYSIFHIAEFLFKRDRKLFYSGLGQ
jgi:hypothetical protein